MLRPFVLIALATLFALPAAADGYDSAGKRDPFRSPLIRDPDIPRDPGMLARFELSQLTLVAVASSSEGRVALVEPPEGPGALLELGSRVGAEQAEVILIGAEHVVLRQERRLLTGSLFVDFSLRLQGPVTTFPTPAPGP